MTSLINRMDHIKDKISGYQDKIDILIINFLILIMNDKFLMYEQNIQEPWYTIKRQKPMNDGLEENSYIKNGNKIIFIRSQKKIPQIKGRQAHANIR